MDYQILNRECRWYDLLEGFHCVIQKMEDLRKSLSVPAHDARNVGLGGIIQILFGFSLNIHAITGEGLTPKRSLAEVMDSFSNFWHFEGTSVAHSITLMVDSWRWSVVSLTHFKVDSLFQNLLSALGERPRSSGFGANQHKLFDLVASPRRDQCQLVLGAFTRIRNSLHNNGIHRGENWHYQGPKLTYDFETDVDVKCAGFGHVLGILDETTDVLREILNTSKVKNCPFVKDRYVMLNP
jgi:hypothetical protein